MNKSLLEQFKKFLIDKGYKPGDKIATEMELSGYFKVSRAKVRETAHTLSQLGILEKKARRGTILKSLDPESVSDDLKFRFSLGNFNPADFQEARSVIEKAIVPLAVKRMTPSLLKNLEDAATIMLDNCSKPELADEADRSFHLILLEACGNQTLQAFGQVIQSLFTKENRRKYWSKDNVKTAANEHIQLIQAIKDSDVAGALNIISKHFKY